MAEFVNQLLQWLNAHPQLAGLVTFIISAGESVAIIGTIVPGSIMMTAIGTLAGAGVIPLWQTILWAILGAIVGDGISYWIGFRFKDRLPKVWPFRNHPYLLKTGEKFFHRYGSMSVFIGRFVGPVRALVPLVAGMLGMRWFKFFLANVTSAIGWAPAYMAPGILLGAASLELPPDIAMHVILALFLITLFILLCLWFVYKSFQLIHNQTWQLQEWIWGKLQASRFFSPVTSLLKHHDPAKTHGQLALAFFAVIAGILFVCLAIYVKLKGAPNILVNDAAFHLYRGLRSDDFNNMMLNITFLGQKQIILPVILTLSVWLALSKRWRAAAHVLALGILASGSVFVLKNIIRSERPWGIFQSPETFSMPSGHSTLSATIYIGLAFLIALSVRQTRRWPIYLVGMLLALAVGTSRLYLGAHWFTDVVSAWLLSAVILMVIVISYQRREEPPINLFGIILVTVATLMVSFSFFHYRHAEQLTANYAQVNWPSSEISMNAWWQKNVELPGYHTSLFGFRSSQINIEWVGNIDQIRETLRKEGWSKPPARDWISTLHRMTDVKSTQYLPMVSPQYLDKKPALILTRGVNDEKNLLVLRLWNANLNIKESDQPVWVGIVNIVPRSYSWLFKKRPGEIEIDPALVFPNKTGIGAWQWKVITIEPPASRGSQKIMLIRQNKSIHKK